MRVYSQPLELKDNETGTAVFSLSGVFHASPVCEDEEIDLFFSESDKTLIVTAPNVYEGFRKFFYIGGAKVDLRVKGDVATLRVY